MEIDLDSAENLPASEDAAERHSAALAAEEGAKELNLVSELEEPDWDRKVDPDSRPDCRNRTMNQIAGKIHNHFRQKSADCQNSRNHQSPVEHY